MTEQIIAKWRSPLQRALHRNRSQPFSRYIQLATVTKEGNPSNRTVVFRGFLENSNILEIITDTRSEKYSHLQNNPMGEICWYFAKTREQFRITGKVDLITENSDNLSLQKARQQLWQKLSNSGKEQFYWCLSDPNNIEINEQIPPANFCLLLFNPDKVDHLELRNNPHQRYIYTLETDNQWLCSEGKLI